MAYHKVECPSREIRDETANEKNKTVVAWTGYEVSAKGWRWFVYWID
jgi:hypothetical protein